MNKIRGFPLLLILTGIIILISNLNWMDNAWGKLWPLLLITIGLVSIINSIEWNCCKIEK